MPEAVQDELLAHARLLEEFGPQLGRPHADTLNGSAHANMKELRFDADDGVWRLAFAFDPRRKAILLVLTFTIPWCVGRRSEVVRTYVAGGARALMGGFRR